MLRRALAAAMTLAAGLALTACGSGEQVGSDTVVVYSAQHEGLTKSWVDAFTQETGIPVIVRSGRDFEIANQIVAEGKNSRADVFLTENSPAMGIVEQAGLFAEIPAATLAQVPAEFTPKSQRWVPVAARSTVFVYNKDKLSADQLPKSLMDLAKPEWRGRWGAAPGGADFQAIVSAMLQLSGQAATSAWLDGMKANAKVYTNNITTMQGVNAGEVDGGVIYSYYWYRDQAKTQENSRNTQPHYFGGKDPGAFVSVSGGGVIAGSPRVDKAQQFLAYVTGKRGQEVLAKSDAMEYVVGNGLASNPVLPPLSGLDAPVIDPATLNGPTVIKLMTDKGLI
ncbi:MAG: iron ABC transporter substrate-binding protein [Actinomycetota bacterium]|nr:MAG: iron ABC transporter substrate-binding protein [Actinomycetota bacterium]